MIQMEDNGVFDQWCWWQELIRRGRTDLSFEEWYRGEQLRADAGDGATETDTHHYCVFEIYPGSYYEQPSYCEDDADNVSPFDYAEFYCDKHASMIARYDAEGND